MPDVILESPIRRRIRLPKWTPTTVGEVGISHQLFENGELVTSGYVVTRSVLLHYAGSEPDRRDVKGLGGIYTEKPFRRRGYMGLWMKAAFAEHQNVIGMLFCLAPLRRRYSALGWRHVSVPVTYLQPNGVEVMPPHVFAMIDDPLNVIDWPNLTSLHIEGLPW